MEPRHAFCNARGCGQNSASELDSGGCYASFYAGSWPAMQRMAAEDLHVVAINLSRNHGHQLALTGGEVISLFTHERIIAIW